MNTTIWIIQALLSAGFITSGLMGLLLPKEKIKEKLPYANDFPLTTVRFIGLSKLLGAIGVLFPSLILDRWSYFVPAAAFGLSLVMIGALIYHIKKRERKELIPPVILLLMSIFVLYQFVIHYLEITYSAFRYGG